MAIEPHHDLDEDKTSSLSARARVLRCSGDACEAAEDYLPVEEPLQIRLAGIDVAVTMRTPGHDAELAVGFLLGEGIISGREQVEGVGPCVGDDGQQAENIVNVTPTDRTVVRPERWRRNFAATSSCGICGKTSLDEVQACLPEHDPDAGDFKVPLSLVYSLEQQLKAAQGGFSLTGGLHAAGLFDLDGRLLVMREDVGRHNAVDKVVGRALLDGALPLDRHILLVSSRASFEIVQKALMAGIRVMAAMSAPSSLAVELARHSGLTLVAFLRGDRLNVYAGEERVTP